MNWQFSIFLFFPLHSTPLHLFGLIKQLWGPKARLLYANDASALYAISPTPILSVLRGSLSSQKSLSVSSRVHQILSSGRLGKPRVTSQYSLANSFRLLSKSRKVTPESAALFPEGTPATPTSGSNNFPSLAAFPKVASNLPYPFARRVPGLALLSSWPVSDHCQ